MRTGHAGRFLAIIALSTTFGLSGCQSWSQLGQPNGSRVPPPGTGTFQVPSNYYNGAAPKPGALGSNVPTTNWQSPSSSSGPSGVVTASATRPALDEVRGTIHNSANNIVREFQNGASEVVQAGARGATGALQTGTNRANEFIQNGTSRIVNTVDNYTDSAPSLRSTPPNDSFRSGSLSDSTRSDSTRSDSMPNAVPTGTPASRSLSDSPATSDVQLNWRAPR